MDNKDNGIYEISSLESVENRKSLKSPTTGRANGSLPLE